MTSEERMRAADLDQYWDALALAQRTYAVEPPDADTADLIDRLWALSAPPGPGVARERVWQRLQHREREERDMDAGPHVAVPSLVPWKPAHANDRTASRPAHASGQAWWRSLPGQLATAALLVLALAGSFIAFGPGRPGQSSPDSAVMPAISAPPAAPETDGVATTLLLDIVIPTISEDRALIQFDQLTFPAATMVDVDMRDGGVPEVFYIVDGTLDVRVTEAPQAVRVVRAGNTEGEALASRASVTLGEGDAVIVPEDGVVTLMNMATEPANVFLLLMPSNEDMPDNETIGYESFVGSIRTLSAPLALTLERVSLAPGTSVPGSDAPNVERAVVPVDRSRVMDARIGSNGSLRNGGDEPLEAYVLTVTSDAPVP